MNWNEYLIKFEQILNDENPTAPYNDPEYFEYTKLNHSRLKRWLKTAVLTEETKAVIHAIKEKQNWILITEPWCGDAAHITPIIYLMSILNDNIHLELQLRDSDSEIDNYLTNGGKSIPIFIVRDAEGKDKFRWGPRPVNAQNVFNEQKTKGEPFERIKEALQHFYNSDKTASIQKELVALLK